MIEQIKGLDPIVDEKTQVIILGSFPGEESRNKRQYYADKRNDFWKIWENIIDESLVQFEWEVKKELLLKHHIGLWDVFSSARQTGSSDEKLENMTPNNFGTFLKQYPNVKLFLIAGDKAYEGFKELNVNIPYYKIQSTSSGNRRWYTPEMKVNQIKDILKEKAIQV